MSRQHSGEPRSRSGFATTTSPFPDLPQAEGTTLPDGVLGVGEESTELLNEFVYPHRRVGSESELLGETCDDDDDLDKVSTLPWWKKPSPWWLLCILPFSASASAATMAPRIEIYTMLACSAHRPDIFKENFPGIELGGQRPSFDPLPSVRFDNSSLLRLNPLFHPNHATNPVLIPRSYFSDKIQAENDPETPPSNRNKCASDPVVQAAVAKLTAVITTIMGILSLITTGWWGAFSDRHGRAVVMGLSVVGLLFNEMIFIVVALFPNTMPGGYWFLVAGPLFEGSFGGLTGATVTHAYYADTTNESNRSQIFSLSLGLLFIGMALGPTLGSLLIRFTGETLSVFYVAISIHFVYALFSWFILPESLSLRHMTRSRAKYANDSQLVAMERMENPATGFLVRLRGLFAFLSPLTVFLPNEEERRSDDILKKPRRDWNLTLMALAYGFTTSLMGSYSYKFQYAASTFGWSAETLGYWLSLIGAARAFFLTVILPITIKLLKSKPVVLELTIKQTETSPLLDPSSSSASSSPTLSQRTVKKEIHSPSFDLSLARISMGIEVFAYAAMALSPTAMAFTVFGMLGAMGAGFSPAMQSATLAMYTRRGGTESGRLFGALSVMQTLASSILGPALYGFIYMKTVATYPRTIFFVTVVMVTISLILLSFVRLPKEGRCRRESLEDLEVPQMEGDTRG